MTWVVLTWAVKQEKGWLLHSSTSWSIQALSGLGDAFPYWGGRSALLSPQIQMLISSRNTLKTHPEIMVNWGILCLVQLTHWIVVFVPVPSHVPILRPHGQQHDWLLITSQTLHKLMSIELVMASSHLILCHCLLLLPSIFPSIKVFSKTHWINRGLIRKLMFTIFTVPDIEGMLKTLGLITRHLDHIGRTHTLAPQPISHWACHLPHAQKWLSD